MKEKRLSILFILLLIAVCVAGRYNAIKKAIPVASITVDEMTSLSLELVFEGTKPVGVSSVQSLVVTDDYFVIAGRPFGTLEQGGETNNKLIIIDRQSLEDVTNHFISNSTTFELGHANGMTYDDINNEFVVVGIRNEYGECDSLARIDATNFRQISLEKLPCVGNGIAYIDDAGCFAIRNNDVLVMIDGNLEYVIDSCEMATDLTNQDIAYYNGKLYLVNWAYRRNEARAVGIRKNQNVIYQFDLETKTMRAFIVGRPKMEMEGIYFIDGEAYVLFNGGGMKYGYYYIYKILFNERDLE